MASMRRMSDVCWTLRIKGGCISPMRGRRLCKRSSQKNFKKKNQKPKYVPSGARSSSNISNPLLGTWTWAKTRALHFPSSIRVCVRSTLGSGTKPGGVLKYRGLSAGVLPPGTPGLVVRPRPEESWLQHTNTPCVDMQSTAAVTGSVSGPFRCHDLV